MATIGLRDLVVIFVGVAPVLFAAAPATAHDPVADFYTAKVVTTGGGTSCDYGARVLWPHLGRHIPGNPKVVVQNWPGDGVRTGTAHVYSVAWSQQRTRT